MFNGMGEWIRDVLYERNIGGDNIYTLNANSGWSGDSSLLGMAQSHPILTPGLLFISNLFAQGKFKVIDSKTKKEKDNHWLIELLKNPNTYQTRIDFLESAQFMKIANGSVAILPKKGVGVKKPDSLYLLDVALISYPNTFRTAKHFRNRSKYDNQYVLYDKGGENLKVRIGDVIWLYDLPNGISNSRNRDGKERNFNVTNSRLYGLKQTLINTHDSLLAKNIILKTNGKELLSGSSNGFPLTPAEKSEAEALFNSGYGVGAGRKRGLVTKATVTWKSLHIALRDLGLDDSIKVDGNLIYTALHIPKDILSLEAKKTTYNNFKESMTSFIQNDIQTMMNDLTLSLESAFLESGEELIGTYDHLPVMQFIQIEKYAALQGRAKALNDLLATGVPEEVALELCEFDKSIKLNPRENVQEQSNGSSGATEEEAKRAVQEAFAEFIEVEARID